MVVVPPPGLSYVRHYRGRCPANARSPLWISFAAPEFASTLSKSARGRSRKVGGVSTLRSAACAAVGGRGRT